MPKQVRQDQVVFFFEGARQFEPTGVGFSKTMKQNQGRKLSAGTEKSQFVSARGAYAFSPGARNDYPPQLSIRCDRKYSIYGSLLR
jgi:hypothetical protein